MKRFLYLSVLFFAFSAHAQTITLNVLKKADESFEKFSYLKAVQYYKLALSNKEKEGYITSQLALSYRNLNEPDSSEVWFKKAIDKGETDPEFKFYLAEALLSNQKIEEAKYWYQQYNMQTDGDNRSDRKLSALDDLDQFFTNRDLVQIEPIKNNSPGLDFSPAFYKEGIMFVSSRPKSSWITQEFNWDHSSFLDLYYYSEKDTVAQYVAEGLNTKYHEGPVVVFNNGKSVAYTRNNFDGKKLRKDAKGVTNLKLYFAEWDTTSSKWINETPFVFNDDEYSISSPTMANDGNTLIFSSNMPGGMGVSDLYISFKKDGNWTTPKNLGDQVNTKGRDGFPSLHENTLYFASEGREGLGGLDVYQIQFDGIKVGGEAENLGAPINSNKDDFGFIRKGDQGYFSTNRIKAQSDDVYRFFFLEPELVLVYGDVYDAETNEPLPLSDVYLENESGDLVYTRSGDLGKYQAYVKGNEDWTVSGGRYDYELVETIDVEVKLDSAVAERIFLKRIPTIISPVDSLIVSESTPVVDTRIKPYEETANFVDEFDIGDTVRLNMIYYDLDKADLREVSKRELVKAANFMIEHVDVRVVLASHTDARSSNVYNKALAKRRSDSAAKYLIEMGGDPLKITKENYGESNLQNKCDDTANCTEEEHQLNRRTEIVFIKVAEQ